MASQFGNEKVNKKFVKSDFNIVYIYFCRFDDKYILTLTVQDSRGVREASITKSCAHYMDSNGTVFENLVGNELSRLYNSLNSEKKDK